MIVVAGRDLEKPAAGELAAALTRS